MIMDDFSFSSGSSPGPSATGSHGLGTPNQGLSSRDESPALASPQLIQAKYPQCRYDLHQLIVSRRNQYFQNQVGIEGALHMMR